MRLRSSLVLVVSLALLAASLVGVTSTVIAPTPAEAVVPGSNVYTWGSKAASGAASGYIYGTPVRGTGTVSTGATATSNPGGGGTLTALTSGGSPVNKFSVMDAFGGGTVTVLMDSARQTTMMAGVRNASNNFEIWRWSTAYLNPTLFWSAPAGEEIVKIASYTTASTSPLTAYAAVTRRGSATKVYTWGSNSNYWTGQNTSTGSTATPTEVTGLSGVEIVDITLGYLSMMAVDAAGAVWVWGDDGYSQLALTTATDQPVPVKLTNSNILGGTALSGVVEIDAGNLGVMARTSSAVYSWGYNTTYTGHAAPTATPATLSISGCTPTSTAYSMYWTGSTGYITGLIGCSEGGVRAFGNNNLGQLGDNSVTTRTTPITVSGLPSGVAVSQVVGGQGSSFARLSDGTVYGWGYNGYRVLGGTSSTTPLKTAQQATRVVHPSGGTFTRMFALYAGAGILDSSGVLYTWGAAPYGMVGRGTKGPSSKTTGSAFARIGAAAGATVELADSTDRGTVVVMSDGTVWTWGLYNGDWNNGDGGTGSRLWPGKIDLPYGPDTSTPSEVTRRLACGTNHCLVATSDGRIFGWGDQTYKQILPTAGTAANYYLSPTLVADLATVPEIAAGKWFSLSLEPGTGGKVQGWGYNNHHAASNTGAATTLTAFTDAISETNAVDIAAGFSHATALLANGDVVVWGLNTSYQHGDGTKVNPASYKSTLSISGQSVVALHATGYATFARMASGLLYAWGTNSWGFLATGGTTAVTTPTSVATSVTNNAGIVALDAIVQSEATTYMSTTVAIDDTGKVWSWGANGYGQLGANRAASTTASTRYSTSPQAVLTSTSSDVGSQLSGVTQVVVGPGWGMGFTPATTSLAPSEPLSVSATAGDRSANVSWSAPTTPRDLRSYTVVVRSADLSTVISRTSVNSTATTATVTGLTNGTTYSVTVYATNASGDSADSSPAVTVTPVAVASAPRNLVATPAATSITVTFEAPTSDGGSSITSYSVTTTNNADSSDTRTATVSASGTLSTVVTGLTAGRSYNISVRAVNAQGSGTSATKSVVIAGRPTQPLDVEASARLGSAVVSWEEPASNGGSAIQSYLVRAYSTGTSTVVSSTVASASAVSATVTGLTDGTSYEVTVTAAQDTATSPAVPTLLGAESNRVSVIAGRPSAPTGVTATRANASATVTWTAVPNVTGITVTGYTVRYVTGSTTATASATCATTTCSTTISSLTNGTEYAVSVAASSSGGLGAYSDAVSVTPATTPGIPTNLEVTLGDGSASLSWDAPTSNGGAEITSYVVTVAQGGTTIDTLTVAKGTAVSTPTAAEVDSLTNGTSYTFTVAAVNAVGAGTAVSSSGTPIGPPSEPRDLTLTPGTTSFIATWTAPESDGGSAVTSYTVMVEADGVTTTLVTSGSGSCLTSTRTCTVTQVDDGTDSGTLTNVVTNTAYTVTVLATNAAGDSRATSDVVTITGQPSAPRNVTATAANRSFEVCITAPATVPTGSIRFYRISSTTDGTTFDRLITAVGSWSSSATCSGAGRIGYTVTTLDSGSAPVNGTAYEVSVSATVTAAPDSSDPDAEDTRVYGMESASATVTPQTTPGAVASVSAAPNGDGSVLVSWTAPTDNGGVPITAYTVRYRISSGSWQTYTSSSLTDASSSASVTGLTPGATYTFEVTASNANGAGTANTTTERAITVPAPATITAPLASTTVSSMAVRFTYVTSTSAPVATAAVVVTPTAGSPTTQFVTLGSDCSLGTCNVTVASLASGTYSVGVRLSNAAGDTNASVASVVLTTPSGSGGSTDPAPSPAASPSPSASASPGTGATDGGAGGGDVLTRDPAQLADGCVLRSMCSGWSRDDGTVRGGDGRELTPIPSDRLGDVPVLISDPVLVRGDEAPTDVDNQDQNTVRIDWTPVVDGSSAGYLLQLRQFGATRWTTFEIPSPAAIVDVTARGYVFEVRVLRNSDFSMVATSARFGAALLRKQSLEFGAARLAVQRPEITVAEDPKAYGGQLVLLGGASSYAQYRVNGPVIALWHPTGPNLGTALVFVDGILKKTIEQTSPTNGMSRVVMKGLGKSDHWVTLVVAAGKQETIGLDAIGPGTECANRCQTNPNAVLFTPRGAVAPPISSLTPATGGRAVSVAFTAPSISVDVPRALTSFTWLLDGKVVNPKRLQVSATTITLRGLSRQTHVLTGVPSSLGAKVVRATARGR